MHRNVLRVTEVGDVDEPYVVSAVYHAVAGRPPFAGERLATLYGAHLFSRPPALDMPDLAGLTGILARGLAKDPSARFFSCSELIAEMEQWHAAAASGHAVVTARAPGAAVTHDTGPSRPAAPAASTEAPAEAPAAVPDPSDPVTTSRWPRVALALAVLAIAFGAYAGTRIVTADSVDDEPPIAAAAGPTEASTAAPLADGVRWRRDLGAGPVELHIASHGLVAETARGAVVVDRETGDVTAQLMSSGGGGVVAENRDVTSVANTLRAVDGPMARCGLRPARFVRPPSLPTPSMG